MACPEKVQALGKCFMMLRFLTYRLMGISRLCPLPGATGRPRRSVCTSHLGAFVLRLRMGDIWGKSPMEELQVKSFHGVNEMLGEMPGAEPST